jgi:hypothetical protein
VEDAARRPPLWRELAVVAFLLVAYDQIANLAELRVRTAEAHARVVLRVENDLHLAAEHSLDHLVALHHRLGQGLSLYYDLAHILVTMAAFAAAYVWAPVVYRRLRTTLLVINLGALALFVALPVAPPRLLPGADYVDVVANSGTWGAWDTASGVSSHANEYASMPSLHVAWALWVVLVVFAMTGGRVWRTLALVHLAATVTVIVVTGNHWVLDAVAGAALAASSYALVVRSVGLRRAVTGLLPVPRRPAHAGVERERERERELSEL